MSGENIKLTRPLCHELWKMVLSIKFLFFYTLPHVEKTLSTTECSSGYRSHMKVGAISTFISSHQLCLVKISSWHARFAMSYGLWCLAFYSPILSHTLKKYEVPLNVARVTGHIWRCKLFQQLVHAISYVWWKFQVDIPPTFPWVMQEGAPPNISTSEINVAMVTGHIRRWKLFHMLVHLPS